MSIAVVAGRNCSRRPAVASPAAIPSPISVITAPITRPRSSGGACRKTRTSSRTRIDGTPSIETNRTPAAHQGPGGTASRATTALLDRYRNQFFAAHRAGLIKPGDYPPEQAYRHGMLAMAETRLSPALAAEVRNRLQEVMNLLDAPDAEDPEGVPVNVLIGFNSPAAPADG
jgi:hypothetical protein